jgi:hypothetical protein
MRRQGIKLITSAIIEFVSRECKIGTHRNCRVKWQGLGFEVICRCQCGHKRNSRASESIWESVDNARKQNSTTSSESKELT